VALLLAALLIGSFLALIIGVPVLVLWKLTRANRVAPYRRTSAPLSWLVSLGAGPRLHRRLRRVVAAVRMSVRAVPDAVTLHDVAGELVARAVAIDDWLVAAGRLHPQVGRPRMHELAAEIREIEVSAGRLHRLSAEWSRRLDQATTAMVIARPDVHQRLDAVEAALRELPGPAFHSSVPYPQQPRSTPPAATARLAR
jgi:hypothetical protein